MITKTRQRRLTNHPTTWAADLTRQAADGASLGVSDLIPIVTIVGGSCRPVETGDGDTVAMLASNGPPDNDAPSTSLSVSPNTAAIRLPIPNVSRPCEHCGQTFAPRRSWGRFCSAYCRRLAWLDRNPVRAAELVERDKKRLKAHIVGSGGEWVN